jgi:hypothetical protein
LFALSKPSPNSPLVAPPLVAEPSLELLFLTTEKSIHQGEMQHRRNLSIRPSAFVPHDTFDLASRGKAIIHGIRYPLQAG